MGRGHESCINNCTCIISKYEVPGSDLSYLKKRITRIAKTISSEITKFKWTENTFFHSKTFPKIPRICHKRINHLHRL
jgi:hypothetical protein